MNTFILPNGRQVGGDAPVFVIAEIGNNHQGQEELAWAAIEAAYQAGSDAVTFQYAPIHTLVVKAMHEDPRVSFLKECEFSVSQLKAFGDKIHQLGMAFSVNVEDVDTLELMRGIGIDFIKLCSADLTNLPYITAAAATGLPIFFSTGASYLGEIETAVNAMKSAGLKDFVLYHTNSSYPTALSDANLLQMDLLHDVFGGVKGYCDHTCHIIPPVVAVSRNAKVIEKHITTNRELKGDDWMVSLEPQEFAQMVQYIRDAELCFGVREKQPLECEKRTREFKRKSVVSKTAIAKGTRITADMLTYKAPGLGISPVRYLEVVGSIALQDIEADVVLTESMLQGLSS